MILRTLPFLLMMMSGAQAQTLSFSLDTISRDSFYLIETFEAAQTKESPRAAKTVTPQLFRDTAQLRLYISNLRNDAKSAAEQAKKYEQASRVWAMKAQAIERLTAQSDWFNGLDSAPVVVPIAPPIIQPKKTKKKKKT
jgi:hypothetical protein